MTVFDDGISAKINELKLLNSIKIKLHLNNVRDDGLPTSEEGERLMRIGPVTEELIGDNGGLFLGRVTTNGVRWNIGLIPDDGEGIKAALQAASIEHRFNYEVFVSSDPEKSAYWEDLYPTYDDRQVMADMDVKSALSERGDDQNAERIVDHWTFFPNKLAAENFASWLSDEGYKTIVIEKQKEGLLAKPRWRVRYSHVGTMVLSDITHHTLKLSRRARETGGDYDGWETPVTK